jgi:Amt family ammonium transporter
MMLLPGLALIYGGLVRAKNLLLVMSQVLAITALAVLTWDGWGYGVAVSGGGTIIGDLSKVGLGRE